MNDNTGSTSKTDTPKSTFMPTPAQRAGIETVGENLLVSAAAGSGKTAVLSRRCAFLVCDAPDKCDVDQLLVVTFTEAAAAEMRTRIEAVLRERSELNPENERLQLQVAQIDRAQISTLHGFCSRVLRQNYHLVDLPPDFRVMEGTEAKLMAKNVVEQMFNDHYENDPTGVFHKFVDINGDGDDTDLQSTVLQLNDLLNSIADPLAWMQEARVRMDEAIKKPLKESAMGSEFLLLVAAQLNQLQTRCAAADARISKMPGLGNYLPGLREVSDAIMLFQKAFSNKNLDMLSQQVLSANFKSLKSVTGEVPGKESAKKEINEIKDEITKDDGSLRRLTRYSETELCDGLVATSPWVNYLLELATEFRAAYIKAKAKERAIDFSDLEHFALTVLQVDAAHPGQPSEVAKGYRRHIAHVLVDEFQDINAVQETILRLVSRERVGQENAGHTDNTWKPNLFCVGDVKQSIYGFRLAEPARFLARYARFKADPSQGKVIDLQSNFRSRAPLLNVLNKVFCRLMTRKSCGIDYDKSHELVPEATFPSDTATGIAEDGVAFTGSPVELHLLLPSNQSQSSAATHPDANDPALDDDLDRTESEATVVAERINSMMGKNGSPRRLVAGRNQNGDAILRPIEYRDMVILLRSVLYKSRQFVDILHNHQIPAHSDAGGGFFDAMEIMDVLSLLAIMDNQQQDIPLAAVLRSPLVGWKNAEDWLTKIRLTYPMDRDSTGLTDKSQPVGNAPKLSVPDKKGKSITPFHEAVRRYAEEQTDEVAAGLQAFLKQLNHFRHQARVRPLDSMLEEIFELTGYYNYCAGLVNGQQSCANLRELQEYARTFGGASLSGLYPFLAYLRELENNDRESRPSVLGSGDDVVRVMTVHKSKGLEFPVVFLPDVGKRFRLTTSTGVLMDRSKYLGIKAVDESRQVRYPSLAWLLAKDKIRRREIAEELRVLYVAMTRAKEHLIVIGTCKPDKLEKWQADFVGVKAPFSAEMILEAQTMLDWIGPVAANLGWSGGTDFKIQTWSLEDIKAVGQEKPQAMDETLNVLQLRCKALQPITENEFDLTDKELQPAVRLAIDRLSFRYANADESRRRATISATEWAKHKTPIQRVEKVDKPDTDATIDVVSPLFELPRFANPIQGLRVNSALDLASDSFDSDRDAKDDSPGLNAADIGTATHLVLEHLDYHQSCDAENLSQQIQSMVSLNLLTKVQAESVDQASVLWFIKSELGQLVRATQAEDVIRELPFNLAVTLSDSPDQAMIGWTGLDQIMLRGRIDLMIRRGGEFIVIDYKTDNISNDQVSQRVEYYQRQVQLYRQAIERIAGIQVAEVYLVFLTPKVIARSALLV